MTQNDFIQTINPFKDKLFRLAKRLLTSTQEAEDATQEVLLKLWNKNQKLNNYNNIEAFAMTMTKNFCLDQLKAKRSNNLKIVDDHIDNNDTNLLEKLEQQDSLMWVNKIMNDLPEQQKIILQLREIEQYEFEEIAKIVNMNENAIRTALSRARKTVKTSLQNIHNYGLR